jgi:hypothetical protein
MDIRIGALAVAMLAGMAEAQPGQVTIPLQSTQSDRTFFFSGEVRLDDASPPPEPVAIYRVCNGLSRFETSTDSKGHFGFQVNAGSNDTMQSDASQNTAAPAGVTKPIAAGSQDLMPVLAKLRNCELQAVLAGYRSELVSIAMKSRSDDGRLGVITLHPLSRASVTDRERDYTGSPGERPEGLRPGIDALAKQKWQAASEEFTNRAPVAGASHIRSVPRAVLGNGNHVADGSLARQDHHQAVQAERDAAVRRRAVFQRFQQKSRSGGALLFAESQRGEHLRLHVAAVNTNRARAQLRAVQAPGRTTWRGSAPGRWSASRDPRRAPK